MNRDLFTTRITGELVKITAPHEDWAFVPAPLPPNWAFPNESWPLLVEARHLLGKLDGIGQTLPNPELLLRPLQQREAVRSSSLEGTYATPEEVFLFDLKTSPSDPESSRTDDWMEVSNYGRALREGHNAIRTGSPLSLSLIRQLHMWLLHRVRGQDKKPGEFRTAQVHVGAGRRYVPPPPTALTRCLEEFERALAGEALNHDPLVQSYLVHYQLEAIHPFMDGNGRVGRLLLALMTMVRCDLTMPWLYMSAYFERYKDEYIDKMFMVSADGRWSDWITFCLQGTIEQASDAIRRCGALNELKRDFTARIQGQGARLLQIVEALFLQPVLTIPWLKDTLGVHYQTAAGDIEKLVEIGILEEIPRQTRPKAYACPAVFAIAYD
jgi:Fic family protein